MNDILLMHIL